ncbi:MAG TPA: tetratricopeptide repeat protein, partial [Candidatus Coatesbacteria bacterium]|nr:tetratricopeptide repeat protein [Candidatus Coatesbacteria bacterium]
RDVRAVQSGEERVRDAIREARDNPPVFPQPEEGEDDPRLKYEEDLARLGEISGWQVTIAQIKLAECHFYSAMNYLGMMRELFAGDRLPENASVDDEAALVQEKLNRLRISAGNGEQAKRLALQAEEALLTARSLLPPEGDLVLEANLNTLQPRISDLQRLVDQEIADTANNQALAQVELGLVLLKDRRYSQALREIQKAENYVPGFELIGRATAEVSYVQGLEHLEGSQEKRAESAFLEALKYDARHYGANLELGKLKLAAGDPAEAVRYLAQALQLKPNLGGGHYFYALALVAQGNPRDALEPFKRAAELGYGVDAYREWGLALEALGDLSKATDVYEDGVRRGGEADSVLAAHLAYLHALRDRNSSSAVRLAQAALDSGGPAEFAWPALVLANYNAGRHPLVVEKADEALAALPARFTTARAVVGYAKAAALYKTDDFAAALDVLEQSPPDIPEALRKDFDKLRKNVVDALTRGVDRQKRDLEKERARLQDELKNLEKELAKPDADTEALQAKIRQAEARLAEVEARLAELEKERGSLRGRVE